MWPTKNRLNTVVLTQANSRKNRYPRRSFRPPLLIGFPEGNQVCYIPEPIRDANRHC